MIVHIISHDWEGIEKTGESEREMFKKYQAVLLNKDWRNFYTRQFDVPEQRASVDETLDEWNTLMPNENVKSRELTEEECQKVYVDITKKIPAIFLKKVLTV